jgi:hypothetical protein
MNFGPFKERLCLGDFSKRIHSHLQHFLNFGAQFTVDVYQEQV